MTTRDNSLTCNDFELRRIFSFCILLVNAELIFSFFTNPLRLNLLCEPLPGVEGPSEVELWGNWLCKPGVGIEGEIDVSLLRVIWICELLTGVGAETDASLLGICLSANESVTGTAGIKAITNKQKNTLIGNFFNGWSLFSIFRIYSHPKHLLCNSTSFTKVYYYDHDDYGELRFFTKQINWLQALYYMTQKKHRYKYVCEECSSVLIAIVKSFKDRVECPYCENDLESWNWNFSRTLGKKYFFTNLF